MSASANSGSRTRSREIVRASPKDAAFSYVPSESERIDLK